MKQIRIGHCQDALMFDVFFPSISSRFLPVLKGFTSQQVDAGIAMFPHAFLWNGSTERFPALLPLRYTPGCHSSA